MASPLFLRRALPLLPFVLALAAFLVPQTGAVAAPAITGLHISGNQILNASNQPIRLLGVNRSGTEYRCIQNNGIFDLYNEPHDISWTCWRNGGSSCSGAPFSIAGMQTLVTTVRNTGATNILLLGGLAFSNDLSQWLANEPTDPMNQLAASWHVY